MVTEFTLPIVFVVWVGFLCSSVNLCVACFVGFAGLVAISCLGWLCVVCFYCLLLSGLGGI